MSVERGTFVNGFVRKLAEVVFLLLGFQVLMQGCGTRAESAAQERKTTIPKALLMELADAAGKTLYETYMPSLAFFQESEHETYWILQEQIEGLLPFYGYVMEDLENESPGDGLRGIALEQARAGDGVEPAAMENSLSLEDLVREDERTEGSSLAELLQAENEAALQMRQEGVTVQAFQPHAALAQVDLQALENYETLLKEFYTVDSNTMAGSGQLDVNLLLSKDMTVDKDSKGPQILIYHTHSQEAFADSIPGDDRTNIQGVGEYLAQVLRDTYGYQVLHHTGEYDAVTRDDAYANALPAIEQILAENPSIQVVIDLHRDEMPEETKLVMDLDGRPTAKVMFFNGLSRTKTTGDIAYLYNENLEDNLAFSFQMQLKAAQYYPGLTRKIYLKGYRYNMHLSPRYLLIELGAQNNTLGEAMNACDPLAHILDLVLSGE